MSNVDVDMDLFEEDMADQDYAIRNLMKLGWPPDAISDEDIANFLKVDQKYHRPMWFLGKAHKKALEQFRWEGGDWNDHDLC